MIVAAHQPHYLPWLGYLDKLAKADLFVVMDDLQYEAQNFQNRNRVKLNTGARVADRAAACAARRPIAICDKRIDNSGRRPPALAAPHVADARDPLRPRAVLRALRRRAARHLHAAVGRACSSSTCTCSTSRAAWLGITRPIVRASSLGLTGQKTDRIIDMCQKVGARATSRAAAARRATSTSSSMRPRRHRRRSGSTSSTRAIRSATPSVGFVSHLGFLDLAPQLRPRQRRAAPVRPRRIPLGGGRHEPHPAREGRPRARVRRAPR